MFTVTVETTFKATHQLTLADGTREELHSHDWTVRIAAGAEHLDDVGLGIDFVDLKALLHAAIQPLDGKCLEQMSAFHGRNASAENLTKHIYDTVQVQLPIRLTLEFVEVMESPGCWTKYSR